MFAILATISQSALHPAGPRAEAVDALWSVLLWTCTVVWVLVVAALVIALFRRRPEEAGDERKAVRWSVRAVAAGAVATIVILFGLMYVTVDTANAIASLARPDALTIDVISRQFWWDVRYHGSRVVTANEIHIPTGVPVRIQTTSADVIHSIWIPRLGGKIDSTPGHMTNLWVQADEPGVFRGQCAEYCGIQHAHMALLVIAQEPHEFEAWTRAQAANAASPASPEAARGRDVFLASGCPSCHVVRGVAGSINDVGPDLTHLASRRTLAAGTLPNRRGHLAGWISDPQSVKKGNLMPPTHLPPEELHALVAYLEGLR